MLPSSRLRFRLTGQVALGLGLAGAVALACSDQGVGPRPGSGGELFSLVPVDTAEFHSLGQVLPIGFRFATTQVPSVRVRDTSIVTVVPGSLSDTGFTLESRRNGTTIVTLKAGRIQHEILVAVAQVADTLKATLADTGGIVHLNQGDPVPLTCRAVDRNGYPLATVPLVIPGTRGTVTAGPCAGVVAVRSGFDTLTVTSDGLSARVPIILVLRPQASSPAGEFMAIDNPPEGKGFWSPSMRRNSRGEFEVFYAGFSSKTDSTGYTRANLHRLVSRDGVHFHYAGVVLRHAANICMLDGRGIENVVIVPRNDGPGWRMLYSGGSDLCYGWQVFSAVSKNGEDWIKEPGVRLSNGGTVPPAAPVYAPWPVGEGMLVDQLPGGGWRMLTGGYEHLQPYEDKFQIVEWRSPDQMHWSYVGPVLTTRDVPPEADASVYSPTIREFAPGLFRMIFTGDNRFTPGGRSRLWSAISTDRSHWRFEGELMGAAGSDLWYAALVDEQLVFVRKDAGGNPLLATATVIMN